MFDLQNYVVDELPVKILKIALCRSRPVVLEISPVHVMVIDETAVKEQTAMLTQRPGYDVRCVSVAAMISRGAEPAFRVCLENEAPEIGNCTVDSVDRSLPEIGDTG